jgi:glycosyltransferase involved in cell wall biosynthesis
MSQDLDNVVNLPFQPYKDVPKVLASAAVLIAPLDPSAGSFCVPSTVGPAAALKPNEGFGYRILRALIT